MKPLTLVGGALVIAGAAILATNSYITLVTNNGRGAACITQQMAKGYRDIKREDFVIVGDTCALLIEQVDARIDKRK